MCVFMCACVYVVTLVIHCMKYSATRLFFNPLNVFHIQTSYTQSFDEDLLGYVLFLGSCLPSTSLPRPPHVPPTATTGKNNTDSNTL